MTRECGMSECASCQDLRAQLATHATTIDRLSDANRVLARECDEARAKLEAAEKKWETLNHQIYSSAIAPCQVHEEFSLGCVRCISTKAQRADQAEARAHDGAALIREFLVIQQRGYGHGNVTDEWVRLAERAREFLT